MRIYSSNDRVPIEKNEAESERPLPEASTETMEESILIDACCGRV